MSRSVLLGTIGVVLLVVIAGVFALLLSGKPGSSTTTSTSTTSVQSTSTSTTTSTTSTLGPSLFALSSPIGVAYNHANGYLYVTNNATGTVSVINVATDLLVGVIQVGQGPAQIAIDPDNGYLYVTNNASSTVSVIDGASNKVIKTISTAGQRPDGIAYDPDNKCLYVAEHGKSVYESGGAGADITVINATTNTLIRGITGINSPTGVAYDSDNGYIYVTTAGVSVQVIDPSNNTMLTQVSVGIRPRGIVFDPTNGYLYVANFASGTISVIDGATNTVVGNPINVSGAISSSPYLMAYNPAKGYVMASNNISKGVNIINDTNNVFWKTVSTGIVSGPAGMAYDPDNGVTYVATFDTNAVVAISPDLTPSYFAAPGTGAAPSA